jgi:hypothetical protein
VIGFDYFSGAFADEDAGSHRVADPHARRDGSFGNTQVFNSVDLEVAIRLICTVAGSVVRSFPYQV